ncbi:hypothetical protein NQ176_g11344 [Zarea fungicola]|uniref:Uncharacterized protein n=1 Tax=Zarea fungicola TaxID=93591 RepID=A0ACC1MBT0_9HYPO|nr:hypothetical protein NQ176_g11344 [Lecanicillium fungicola]
MSSAAFTSPLPLVQKAIWVESKESSTNVTLRHDVPVPLPGDYDVLVKVEFSGLCHSDVYNITGAHPMDVKIAGHEGVGHVVQVGSSVPESGAFSRRVGQRVGVKWIHETCGDCAVCERDETLCDAQHNSGRDRPGTLQQYVVVPAKHASPIPDGVESKIAAPLLCAGLTMYSAIAKTNSQKNDWVVIQGAGGGLGHM